MKQTYMSWTSSIRAYPMTSLHGVPNFTGVTLQVYSKQEYMYSWRVLAQQRVSSAAFRCCGTDCNHTNPIYRIVFHSLWLSEARCRRLTYTSFRLGSWRSLNGRKGASRHSNVKIPPYHTAKWPAHGSHIWCSGGNKHLGNYHDDVIKWKHHARNWQFVRGIKRSSVNSPHKSQWLGALMFSLICAWTNGWVRTHEAGDLRRHRAHYDVIVMY